MVQTLNFINLSSQQAPNDVNWTGLVNSGVQGVLIRLGHGIIRDPCASGHIAKAKQYGLYWHGYHTYEGVVNEPQFTIKNATELGLSTSQYYLVDLTKSSDPFNDYYALHANWLSEGYSTGLLISNEDYLSKFTDSEVTASGSLRWLISDTEPANYDIWQYSSEGTIGTSSVKIGFNFAKTDKLKYNLSTTLTGADINKDPYNPQAPVGGAYIGWGYDTTGLGGGKTFGYSTNGKNFYALVGPKGLVVRKSDGNRIYGTIADQIDSAISANVIPAKSAADSAVAYANDAIEKSKVNSQAIDDINSAVSDAASDAAVARSDGLRAWNAAQSNVNLIDLNYASASAAISSARTEAIAAADEAKKSASAAQADIVAVRSDVAVQAKSISSYAEQASAAGNDITTLKSQAGQLEQDMASTKGDVSQLKVSASSASVALSDAAGNISSLQATAKSYSAALSDTNSNVASVMATASELETKYADAAGDINTLKTNASGFSQTLTNAQGDISTLKSTVSGVQTTLTDAQGNISTLQSDVSGLKKTTSDHTGSIATLQATANTLTSQMSGAQGDISTLKQTASGISSQVSGMSGDLNNLKSQAQWVIVTDTVDLNNIKTPCHEFLKGGVTNAPNEAAWWYLTVEGSEGDRITQTVIADQSNNRYTRRLADSWSAWVRDATQTDVTSLSNLITANTTAINQNKNAISLKADQTAVDKINGTVSQLQSSLTVQAGQIQEKVTSSQVTGMLAGYATQDYTQSLVTQKANDWNLNLTALQTQVDNSAVGTNLLMGTSSSEQSYTGDFSTVPGFGWGNTSVQVAVNAGSTYTYSINLTKLTGSFVLGYWAYDSNKNYTTWIQSDTYSSSGKTSWTFTVPSGVSYIVPHVVHASDGFTCTAKEEKLERGSHATDWSPAPSDMATVTSVTNLSATVDGIQAQVYNSDGSSKITQLSNLIATKVSQGDYNSQITQLKNDINQRVQVGDVISQINQEAGGDTLIQVSNGKKSLILDAGNTIITGKAWIPSAAIANLTADQVQAGTLKGVKVDFRDSTGTGMIADGSTLTFDVSNTPAGYLSYNGMPVAELPDGSGGNELAIRYGLSTAIIPGDNSGAQATFSKAAQKIAYMTGTNQGKQMLSGLEVHSNNHHWLCAVNSDATCNRFEVNDRDGLNIAWHDNTHLWISDGKAKLYKDNNDSQTATELEVHGWAWVNGWVEAAGHSQHSTLSSKTRIEEADPDYMLDLVNNTDLTTFAFKSEVAEGLVVRHIGPIIDDVNDVAQYRTPAEFIAPTKTARDDDNMIGALFGAVQALTKRIKKLEDKLNG